MGDMAKKIEAQPFDILDINMGCPVPKVVNNNEGSALMKDPGARRKDHRIRCSFHQKAGNREI